MVMDQPLFTLAKRIQWKYTDTLGEDKFVVMLGAMHAEKMLYDCLGDWMEGSGWTALPTNSGVVNSGVADFFLKACHLTRTRYMHQVTALALYNLLHQAYTEYKRTTTRETKGPRTPIYVLAPNNGTGVISVAVCES